MLLDEHYKVEHDGTQWVLSYEKISDKINAKTKKPEVTKKQFYHNRLETALGSYMDKKLVEEETIEEAIITLKGLLEEVRNLNFNELK